MQKIERAEKKTLPPKRHITIPEIENSNKWDKNVFKSY